MESKKILILSNHFITLYNFRRELIARLISRGHKVYISMPEDERNGYFAQLGCEIIVTPMSRRGMNPAQDISLLRQYKQVHFVEVQEHAIQQSFARIGHTLRHMKEDKQVFWFLLAFFCYIDGVYTIIDMATAYGTALGLDTTGLLLALLVTQIVAFPSALVFGRLSGQYPSGTLIPVCIAAYAGIALFAFFLKHQWQFWVLAVVVGMFQGGIQALSRSHFAKIIPPEKSGEYFGLFDICGKGASFLGTMIVSVGSQLTGSANVGVGSLIVLFVVGFVLFRVSDQK